jgi:hypothetical protein
VEE